MATITSALSDVVSISVPTPRVWLKDPVDPALNHSFKHGEKYLEISRKKQRATFRPLGRKLPVVIRGESSGDEFSFKFLVLGDDDWDALNLLLESNRSLLLQTPKQSWYVDVSGDIAVKQDQWSLDLDTHREVVVPFTQVDRPSSV